MKLRKIMSAYSIFIGLSMIGLWLMLWLTGEIPELSTEPIRIGMHLAAEFSTAVLLLVGGITLLKGYESSINIFQISMGMLIYTLIQSPGYYAQQGDLAFVGMFAVFLMIALILTGFSLIRSEEFS